MTAPARRRAVLGRRTPPDSRQTPLSRASQQRAYPRLPVPPGPAQRPSGGARRGAECEGHAPQSQAYPQPTEQYQRARQRRAEPTPIATQLPPHHGACCAKATLQPAQGRNYGRPGRGLRETRWSPALRETRRGPGRAPCARDPCAFDILPGLKAGDSYGARAWHEPLLSRFGGFLGRVRLPLLVSPQALLPACPAVDQRGYCWWRYYRTAASSALSFPALNGGACRAPGQTFSGITTAW
ncbi:hypothetical protein Mrose_02988 [Calidithermus roseus]|uniref:Uncharacterized protein n=1 Tax=Calidithermus roseus TaxID=1644118 RepID=A0A399EIS1_9DEIN|nr:hypothetical protein Mrose_02988 [Calidithermus roseus]